MNILIKKQFKQSLFLFFLIFSQKIYAGENRENQVQILNIAHAIEDILIQKNICISKIDCQKKKLYFVSPSSNGISIQTYSINDLEVLKLITYKCIDVFYKSTNISIKIDSFTYTKDFELKSFFKKKHYIQRVNLSK